MWKFQRDEAKRVARSLTKLLKNHKALSQKTLQKASDWEVAFRILKWFVGRTKASAAEISLGLGYALHENSRQIARAKRLAGVVRYFDPETNGFMWRIR